MGYRSRLSIGGVEVFTNQGVLCPLLLSVFVSSDLITAPKLGTESLGIAKYVSTVNDIKERLDAMGFYLNRAKEAFTKNRQEFDIWKIENGMNLDQADNFSDFSNSIKAILTDSIGSHRSDSLEYLQLNGLDSFPHDFDPRILLRVFVEVSNPNDPIEYDFSEILEDIGDCADSVYEDTLEHLIDGYEIGEKIIILTEGSSDIFILKQAIHLLFPHLETFYTFMDFNASNSSGSASSLVATVKSFVGANLRIKVIALFDNDTAGEVAIKGLKKTVIPNNIKIMQFPPLTVLENYPTIGPSGVIQNMNINGLAGSIEMYLGNDSLKKDGELIPIQWKGYDSSLKKYQGVIIDKQYVQNKYQENIKACERDASRINDFDWSGLQELLKMVINAFDE